MSNQKVLGKSRITYRKTNLNEHIITLLKDLYSQNVATKTARKLEQALLSLSKYPMEITSGKACNILQGFDRNLCEYVDEKLFSNKTILDSHDDSRLSTESFGYNNNVQKTMIEEINMDADVCDGGPETNQIDSEADTSGIEITKKNQDVKKSRFLERRSKRTSKGTGKAITRCGIKSVLIALYRQQIEFPCRPALNKKELILKAQEYTCQDVIDWRFLRILEVKKKLIAKEPSDCGEQYKLTPAGKVVAKKLSDEGYRVLADLIKKTDLEHRHNEDCVTRGCRVYRVAELPLNVMMEDHEGHHFIDMPPGSYEIVMLVDKNEPETLSKQGSAQKYKSESRSLKVGDILWVARSKTTIQELVLPYIIERKRMDDFAASIKDGRFHEQKFRLRKCGIRNVIYLIEDHAGKKYCGLPMATLNQAMVNTRVHDGFMIHYTDSLKGTKRFLDMMTERLVAELEGIHLRGNNAELGGKELMTFEFFNAQSSKTKSLKAKEVFIKMLLQLKGLSVEKALAITKVYDCPDALMKAYDECDAKDGELLLAKLRYNSVTPKVGPAISKIIYMLFNKM